MTTLVRAITIQASPPSLQDNTADLDRLLRALGQELRGKSPVVPYRVMETVAGRFRRAGFAGAAIVNDLPTGMELVDFVGEKPAQLIAMGLDLGTTHLEACLVDMLSGRVLARMGCENSQTDFGADILARLHFACKDDGLDELHRKVIGDVNKLASLLAAEIGVKVDEIRGVSVAGNTTMVHFFLRLDPYHICREPYIPVVNSPGPIMAGELALAIHPAAPVWVLPSVGSYFGGDLVSGILVSGMTESEKTSMLIDVGTNAEVIVGNREWLIACAGAAGPALEGGVARMGMRAGPGAIEHVRIDRETGRISYKTIGNQAPKGICGSGVIDLVAELYLAGMIDFRGKFVNDCSKGKFVENDGARSLVVAEAEESSGNTSVLLSQIDLDALMRSKAAMYAILTTLVNQVGLGFAELEKIYVAGAFGQHIDPEMAIILGMLPDLPRNIFEGIGNSSLAGAVTILLHREKRLASITLPQKITYVELNVNQEFMMRFSGAKCIPHTDHSLFPTVPILGRNRGG